MAKSWIINTSKSGQLFVLVLCINELFALDLEFKTVINMKQLASSLIQECQSPCSLYYSNALHMQWV